MIGVGTTVVRALESAMRDGELLPFAGETQIFITPGYRIRSVDAMVTNFHLPESTLLMMISAFAGKDRVFEAYRHAIEQRYRFFSYGDAMLLFPQAEGLTSACWWVRTVGAHCSAWRKPRMAWLYCRAVQA